MPEGRQAELVSAPSFGTALRLWASIGFLSFGGPAGQIALMQRLLVDERRWIDQSRFLHALGFCMLLPGPEAQQLATYCGWRLHGWAGGLTAGTLFVLPGFVVIALLSALYALLGTEPAISAVFFGVQAAVIAIVLEAMIRMAKRALARRSDIAIAMLAFAALFVFNLPFPVVVLAAGLFGLAFRRGEHQPDSSPATENGGAPARQSVVAAAVFCALWALPFALLAITGSGTGAFLDIAIFFSQMAVVTFGGAYAVLAFVAQQAVETYGWLQPAEMIDGLALAETTPGPLVLVLGFVGFLAGFRDPGALPPLVGGFAGLTLATWVTFVPCFLWIFVFAPHMERLRNSAALAGALSAILAAIVGVIANLALWFALHVLFADVGRLTAGPVSMPWPGWSGIDPAATLLAGAAAVALLRYRLPMLAVLASAAAAGPAMLLFGNILNLG